MSPSGTWCELGFAPPCRELDMMTSTSAQAFGIGARWFMSKSTTAPSWSCLGHDRRAVQEVRTALGGSARAAQLSGRGYYWIFRLLTTSRTPATCHTMLVARVLSSSLSTLPVR